MGSRASTPIRRCLSHTVGWLADRSIPGFLRAPLFRAFCAATGADPSEAALPLHGHASLGAFFVRRLKQGARTIAADSALLPSPCDGRVQATGTTARGRLVQAKGIDYGLDELLAGAGEGIDLEGAATWTLYLSPRDYHRVHAPLAALLEEVRWVPGARRSVAPRYSDRIAGLFSANERAVLRLATPEGPYLLTMVGALNVGRIRVVGVEPRAPRAAVARHFGRGEELARFELGSTVVLIVPKALGFTPLPELTPGGAVRLGEPIGRR